MTPEAAAKKILDTMLGHLGFPVNIELQQADDGPCLQILTSESPHLIGKDGGRLDDMQYLVNRILRKHFPEAPRVKVDCEHYRAIQEDKLVEEVQSMIERVKVSGKAMKMRPLNAYYRRLVHNVLLDETEVESISPSGDDRLKRIILRPRSNEKEA
ncbi:spoIIIJ-associated protein [Haloferula luteola]|uniref:SpoIIIJ-associated protein n=1 Tax=Haloferula luteola TaxID=595692 RepID=A0A840UZY6_9BACT|nr:R3H domain-containing nucleic acid-binding protein [Haloferula luteola]MBB5351305.1 spoIIIJ-associated protein [Haloferula luteola]